MVTGIIAEYNPFHNGHLQQINSIKKENNSPIIVCLSGSLTQRGELAILDKWTRAAAAIESGADLIIELPTIFALRSAEHFALGGVQLLDRLGIVDQLAFGTCYPEIQSLKKAASINIETYTEELRPLLLKGLSYGAASSHIISKYASLPMEMLREPNTILGIEYIRALNKENSHIRPLALYRQGAGHNDITPKNNTASGTFIRTKILEDRLADITAFIPSSTLTKLSVGNYPNQDALLPLLTWQLLNNTTDKLKHIYGINEGLEHLLLSALPFTNYKELISSLTSRRYPATRMQRQLLYILLSIRKEQLEIIDSLGPLYIRVLAFNDTGRTLLKKIKKASPLPIITKLTPFFKQQDLYKEALSPLQEMLRLDILASNLRQLCCIENGPAQLSKDMLLSPIYLPADRT